MLDVAGFGEGREIRCGGEDSDPMAQGLGRWAQVQSAKGCHLLVVLYHGKDVSA